MKHGSHLKTFLLLFFLLTMVNLFSQNLLVDNPHTPRARQLRAEAEQAIADGEYIKAVELAEEAEKEQSLAVEWAELRVLILRANSARNLARAEIARIEAFRDRHVYADELEQAKDIFSLGEKAFQNEDYAESRIHYADSRALLFPLRAPDPQTVESDEEKPSLPQYYIVQRREKDTDTFWRIANYDFIYGQGSLWPKIYEANRHILVDPDNPNLIYGGMKFEIPAIDGETRAGTWGQD